MGFHDTEFSLCMLYIILCYDDKKPTKFGEITFRVYSVLYIMATIWLQ